MLTQDTVLRIFSEQLNGWRTSDLQRAVAQNRSLAQDLQRYRSIQVHGWRGLASSYRFLDRRGYDKFVQSINYQNVLKEVRRVNPELARAVEATPQADGWLLQQIKDVRGLILD